MIVWIYQTPTCEKNFVIQTPWYLSSIYNMAYSLVLGNKVDSPREYFRLLYLQNGITKWYIEVEYIASLKKLTATRSVRNYLKNIKVPIWIKILTSGSCLMK